VLDFVLLGGLLIGFALLVTAHVALSVKLALRQPHWQGAVALIVPPFAPLWGFRAGFSRWSWSWIGAVVLYALARVGTEIVR
jgi:hypothetical protein